RLGNTGCFAGTGRDLHSTVAVGLEGFDLGDQVGLNLDHSNRNSTTIVHEQARHADLAANNTNCHIFTSRVRGFHPLWPLDVVTPGVMCSRLQPRLICTSTPAARSSFMRASTVFSVGSTMSSRRLCVLNSYWSRASLLTCGETSTVKRSFLVGSGIGPRT